jgi:hypothetical protein
MAYWVWILLIVGLSILVLAIFYWSIHLSHRSIPARQAPQGDPEMDISAPIRLDVAHADDRLESSDAMAARDRELERERRASPGVRDRNATYEIVSRGSAQTDVVEDLPPVEPGVVLFHQGSFWRVDAIEPAQSDEAEGRLLVSRTTDER